MAAVIVVFGGRSSSPLFRKEQAHAKWPGELIRIVPLARSGERAVDRDLASINFPSYSAPLTNNANDLFTGFRDRHPINDQCSVVTLDRFGNAFPKLGLDILVALGTLADKPFESFLIRVHFLGDVGDGVGISGTQEAPEVPGSIVPGPFELRPAGSIWPSGER